MNVPPALLDQVHHGDAVKLLNQIPDGSVDLIFTDPVYDCLEHYLWLEQVAVHKLKPEGNILAFQSAYRLAKTLRALETELPVLSAIQQTNGNLSGNTIAKSYHLVWMGSGKTVRDPRSGRRRFALDGYVSNTWSKAHTHVFAWEKNPLYVRTTLKAFANPGAVVFDPFCGSGTVVAVAKLMGMHYVGVDCDAERVAESRFKLGEAGQAELAKVFAAADRLTGRAEVTA